MLTFDKLKLVTSINDIEILDENQFNVTYQNGIMTSMKFYQDVPFLLMIKIDYVCSELVIEFTGKILKSEYKKLISIETIRQCFENINDMGFCLIDVEEILSHAQVVKCDVTIDLPDFDMSHLSSYISANLTSYRQYQCRTLRNGNLIIEKNVTTKKLMKRLTIYDKGKEMKHSANLKFAQEYGMENYFEGVCRFEMNLNTKEQIRNALGISDTGLQDVLTSTANPILDCIVEVISPKKSRSASDKKTYLAMLVLKDNDYDLARVEAKMREFHPRGTSISKVMEIYRSVLAQTSDANADNQYQKLVASLSKCINTSSVSV